MMDKLPIKTCSRLGDYRFSVHVRLILNVFNRKTLTLINNKYKGKILSWTV